MSATILAFPARATAPAIGDEVALKRDGARGYVEKILPNRVGIPALAVVRVAGGFGGRVVGFSDFDIVGSEVVGP